MTNIKRHYLWAEFLTVSLDYRQCRQKLKSWKDEKTTGQCCAIRRTHWKAHFGTEKRWNSNAVLAFRPASHTVYVRFRTDFKLNFKVNFQRNFQLKLQVWNQPVQPLATPMLNLMRWNSSRNIKLPDYSEFCHPEHALLAVGFEQLKRHTIWNTQKPSDSRRRWFGHRRLNDEISGLRNSVSSRNSVCKRSGCKVHGTKCKFSEMQSLPNFKITNQSD